MRKIFTILLLFGFINACAAAVEFDASIDSNIRKDFNVDAYSLPPLPSSAPAEQKCGIIQPPAYNPTGKMYILKRGTKINLVSQSVIADSLQKGNRISFAAPYPVSTKEGAIIPVGTQFKGIITDAHTPQLTGNGGLVELKIDEIYYNGLMSKIDSKVSLVNSKKVFLSNIKGKRSYWHNYSKALEPGRRVFNGAQHLASYVMPVPFVNILGLVPLIGGAAVYTVNFAAAPFIAVFTKGGSLSLPAGTLFQITITKDTQIKG